MKLIAQIKESRLKWGKGSSRTLIVSSEDPGQITLEVAGEEFSMTVAGNELQLAVWKLLKDDRM